MAKEFALNLTNLAEACVAGKHIYLTGRFGGFGGMFYSAHTNLEEAKTRSEEIKAQPAGWSEVFKIRIEKVED